MIEVRRLAVAGVLSIALGVGSAAAAPPSSPGSPTKGESTKKGESAKKPGKDCGQLTRNSGAFQDCVAAQAKSDKTNKNPGKGKKTP
jgi:hypothetical protein